MKRSLDQAIVLRRVNYGESDRVVTLLAKTHGKISVFAKGARKSGNRLSGGIELLTVSEVSFIDGRRELKTLTGASLKQHFQQITADLGKTRRVFEALKKVDTATEPGAGQEYFPLTVQYLQCFADPAYDGDIVQMWFELRLLQLAGLLGAMEVRPPASSRSQTFRFDYDERRFIADENGPFKPNDIKLLRLLGGRTRPVRLHRPVASKEELLHLTQTLYRLNQAV